MKMLITFLVIMLVRLALDLRSNQNLFSERGNESLGKKQ